MAHAITTVPQKQYRMVYILSDSTGNLPRHMMAAFATQFPPSTFSTVSRSFIHSEKELADTLRDIAAEPGIVLHAFVSIDLKRRVEGYCRRCKLPCRDLTGDFVHFLAEQSGIEPTCNQQRLHELDENYFRRIKSLEFALEHDDGLGATTLHEADLVLVGVSRTGKTPTCIYLAQQAMLAGNVSLVFEVSPPRELLILPPSKVVGLTIDPDRLVEIRSSRYVDLGVRETAYTDRDQVAREVRWSRQLFNQQGWPTLDVTYQAIEETAMRAIELVRSAKAHAAPAHHATQRRRVVVHK